MSKNNRTIMSRIVASLLLVVTILSTLLITGCSSDFNYEKKNLKKYIEFKESYKDFKIHLDIAKPHDIDVEVAILNMLYEDRVKSTRYEHAITSAQEITAGDEVEFWYRGYIVVDGEEIELTSLNNMGSTKPSTIGIGSNSFFPGFELNMIGKNTGDYTKFNKLTSGNINESHIAYVSYTRVKGSDDKSKTTATNLRIDLSKDLDATYGVGFKEKLLSLAIGEKMDMKLDIGDSYFVYTDFKLNFATDCENENPMVIECYVPYEYTYQTDIRNETIYFDVYVESVMIYDCPVFDDEYLKSKMDKEEILITVEDIASYEGSTLVEKYRNFSQEKIEQIYEDTKKSELELAIWDYLDEICTVNKYPESEVERVFNGYVDFLSDMYVSNGGMLYNSSTGQYDQHKTLDAYIAAYLGITSTTWQSIITKSAESEVKKRLIVHYILKEEGLLPSDELLQEERDMAYQYVLDQAIATYLYNRGTSKEDYTEEEYAEIIKECENVVEYNYDEYDFINMAYENIFITAILEWPKVTTLDDIPAYPRNK